MTNCRQPQIREIYLDVIKRFSSLFPFQMVVTDNSVHSTHDFGKYLINFRFLYTL